MVTAYAYLHDCSLTHLEGIEEVVCRLHKRTVVRKTGAILEIIKLVATELHALEESYTRNWRML